jgi:hypothetical protein
MPPGETEMKQVLLKESRRGKTTAGRAELGLSDLMLAVLQDALGTYKDGLTSPVPAKRVEAFKVEAWVASDDGDWPFAFLNVCHAVGISPEYVRSCMTRWRREALRENDWVN